MPYTTQLSANELARVPHSDRPPTAFCAADVQVLLLLTRRAPPQASFTHVSGLGVTLVIEHHRLFAVER